ncbi:hypothetical protein V1281_001773 [Nitrobacteraceae bacterium AZCC 2161]
MPLTFDQIQRAAEADIMPADVAASVLAAGWEYIKAEGKISIEQAFGVAVPSGGEPWHVRLGRHRRDQALRSLGEVLQPVGTTSDRADAVRHRIQRYRSTWQRRDQYLDAPPAADPVDALLFVAFRACGGSIPDSPDHLRKLLAA